MSVCKKVSSPVPALFAVLTILAPSAVLASDYDYSRRSSPRSDLRAGDSVSHPLSIAGGVAAPSATGYFGENPAGLIFNRSPNVRVYMANGKDHPELTSSGISGVAGNGLAAAMIGYQSFSNATDEQGKSISNLNFGLATYAEALNMSVGITGSYRPTAPDNAKDPTLQKTWSADIGILFNPFGSSQFGATFYGLSDGLTAVAIGVATELNSVSIIALDVSSDNKGKALTVKPGIGVHAGPLYLSYSYGMKVNKEPSIGRAGIPAGNTIGLGYDFSPSFSVIGYYNHFSTFYVGATIQLF